MRIPVFAAAFILAASFSGGAMAGMPVKQKMTCPIGGKGFEFTTTASYSIFGERPDGKPFGSWSFPLALPECPDNGLVMYKDYDAAEVAKLEPLIASDAYQALRKDDTQYYRAYWLMREMKLGSESYLWALLQASWEADGKPELKARYQSELVAESAKVAPNAKDLNWVGMEGRAINALRELGRFNDALARLDALPPEVLTAPAGPPAKGEAGEAARARAGWASFFKKLRIAVERKDSASEPFDMLPEREWMNRCRAGEDLSEAQQAYCTAHAAALDEDRAAAAKREQEMKLIGDKREKSGR